MIKALITEKSLARTTDNQYSFTVSNDLSKSAVAKLVKSVFGVDVLKVRTIRRLGKIKRTGKVMGKRSNKTIAIVTLKKGQKIDGFELTVPEEKHDHKHDHKEDKNDPSLLTKPK